MPYPSANDTTRLYYKDMGSGDPVVFLHGWPLTGDMFDDAAVALAEAGKRCIVPDRRGFGRSDQPWTGYDYDTFADDVVAILDHAAIAGQVALVGFSMGGGEVARLLTRLGTGRVSHAVVIGAAFIFQTSGEPHYMPQDQYDAMIAGIRHDRADFMRTLLAKFFGQGDGKASISQAVLDDAWRQAMMAGLRPTLAAMEAVATTDFRPDLASFAGLPALVIQGTADATTPTDEIDSQVAAAVPNDGSAHGLCASPTSKGSTTIMRHFSAVGPKMAPTRAAPSRSATPADEVAV